MEKKGSSVLPGKEGGYYLHRITIISKRHSCPYMNSGKIMKFSCGHTLAYAFIQFSPLS